jgi:lipoprotein NlpI
VNRLKTLSLTAFALLAAVLLSAFGKPDFEDLLQQASDAFGAGMTKEALALLDQAVAAEPENPRGYFERARFSEATGQSINAVADYVEVLKREPSRAQAWQSRGTEHFKLGHIKESIADFDKFLSLVPQQAPHHWQRGIAYYYAGRFTDGRKQFELHQTVNPNDVENAVWHFLCVTRESGVEKARAALIPIKGDGRVPMMEVHALFAGKAKPDDVLKAAKAGTGVSFARRKQQLFYAYLYLGLYYEALGDDKQAREHITKAAGEFLVNDYMGDVARVHKQLRWPDKTSAQPNPSP